MGLCCSTHDEKTYKYKDGVEDSPYWQPEYDGIPISEVENVAKKGEALKGADLLVQRVTYVPSFRNFMSLKFVNDIKEHYNFSDKIGEGSFGTVTLATHIKS